MMTRLLYILLAPSRILRRLRAARECERVYREVEGTARYRVDMRRQKWGRA